MPQTTYPVTTRRRRHRWRLIALSSAVLLAHWAVLRAAPLALAAHEGRAASANWAFATRSIAVADTAAPGPDPAGPRLDTPVRKRSATRPVPEPSPAGVRNEEQNRPAAPDSYTPIAIDSIATETAMDSPATDAPTLLAAASPLPKASDTALEASPPTPSAASPAPPAAKALRNYVFPPSARLKYEVKGEVKGFPYHVNGELLWVQDGKTYDARMEISHFLLGSRVQTSKGHLSAHGLEPDRFGDKVRSEVAAHFEREQNKVSFSANTPDAPLLAGAQDQLSVFMQIAAMLGGEPQGFPRASTLPFQTVGSRSAEAWVFVVGAHEQLALPGGNIGALRLSRDPVGAYDPKVEIWLAPDLGYLPVRIRLTQTNGDFVDQQWRATRKP